jgi:N-acetylglucosaminylphosphatidylinositol deacetylase
MFLVTFLSLLSLYLLYHHFKYNSPPFLKSKKKILLVIAHPDDEVMFFGPTLLAIKREEIPIQVLCLSNGNADSLGQIRESELKKSLYNLGISDVIIVNDDAIKDGFHSWDPVIISSYIQKYSLGVSSILTFDDYGISGHPNHISLYHGLKAFLKENTGIKGYCLKSISIIRKFTFMIDIIPTIISSDFTITASVGEYFTIRNSMLLHQSQMLWFRYFYITLSRYMIINDWEKV